HRDGVAGKADDALDEVLLGMLGIAEDHDVAARGYTVLEPTVRALSNEDMVAGKEGRRHARLRDLEGFDEEGARQPSPADEGDQSECAGGECSHVPRLGFRETIGAASPEAVIAAVSAI